MSNDDDFWDDLLAHILHQQLVPIAGPQLNTVLNDGAHQPLTEVIAQHLVKRYEVSSALDRMTMCEAAAAVLREHGRGESDRLYRVVNDVIERYEEQPCAPLSALAAITDIRLFISTTPDRMLARAVNEVRFSGYRQARELTFAPNQATGALAPNLDRPDTTDTVIVRLFGQAASTPRYAIHDEDLLEWLHSLSTGSASLPEWVSSALKYQPLLFVGCELPCWLGRFILRLSSRTRLSMEDKQLFFVRSPTASDPSLSSFFATHCRRTQVQQLEMDPTEFVAQLRSRWQGLCHRDSGSSSNERTKPGATPATTIFISYIREDIAAARRLTEKIAALGGDVWLDERRLRPGDYWKKEILESIRRVRLFIPIISENTRSQEEGFVFREWHEAAERSKEIRRRFIIPVMIDNGSTELSAYQLPEQFEEKNIGFAPAGDPDPSLCSTLVEEIRAMRRPGDA